MPRTLHITFGVSTVVCSSLASYLVLTRDNECLPDRVPSQLPRPTRIYHVGRITIAAWPFDIAADLK